MELKSNNDASDENFQKQSPSYNKISSLNKAVCHGFIHRQARVNISPINCSQDNFRRLKYDCQRKCSVKLERISYESLLHISKSPRLLRKYCQRQEQQIKRKTKSKTSSSSFQENFGKDFHGDYLRSSSSSSGYESAVDTNYSSTPIFFSPSSPDLFDEIHRRRQTLSSFSPPSLHSSLLTCSMTKKQKLGPNTLRRTEYAVQTILSIEAVQGNPLFFVKWKNYPSSQNTWEPIENVIDCHPLEVFLEQAYQRYEKAVIKIRKSIEAEILEKSLSLDLSNMSEIITKTDNYHYLEELADLILLAQLWLAGSKSKAHRLQIRRRVINAFLLKPYIELRRQQLLELSMWKNKVNAVETMANVDVENFFDFDIPDKSFIYIKNSFSCLEVPQTGSVEDPPIGCRCKGEGCNWRSNCCPKSADENFAYDKHGRLRIRPGSGIYECNSLCSCGPDCINRVIQRGRNNSLCIFKTTTGCGWGLRTNKFIRKGDFVCEYVGEIITAKEADERGKKYDAIGRTYLFDLDYNTSSSEVLYTIDAANYGNVSHFINHSCDPNLAVFPFWIDCWDINLPGLAFFSLRYIKPGEELTFDYTQDQDSTSTYTNLSHAEKVACRCGAANCRKVLF